MKVKYRFQSLDKNNYVVGNKDKIYEVDLKEGEKPTLINCVEARLLDMLKNEIKSPLDERDVMMEAELLALKTTHFEIVECEENDNKIKEE